MTTVGFGEPLPADAHEPTRPRRAAASDAAGAMPPALILLTAFGFTALTVVVTFLGAAGVLLFFGGVGVSVLLEWLPSQRRKR